MSQKQSLSSVGGLQIAPFKFDVTPPLGHSCCGGWIKPVEVIDDALEANGLVLLGAGRPIVLCAVDWTGLSNATHLAWRTALAEAAGTTPDRVAVQCVHQHNAPFVCFEAERLVAEQGDLPHIMDLAFFQRCLDRAREAVTTALRQPRPVTHFGWGQGRVVGVASNRRVYRDAGGRIIAMRGSSCRDPEMIKLTEGLIDPFCKTVAFFNGDRKVAALHYYATHPMSFYADGRVTSDFAGLARKQRQQDEPDCHHIYFTGCAGNIGAGKYNDGTPAARLNLTRRIYEGMIASESNLTRLPVSSLEWKTTTLCPPPRRSISTADLATMISTRTNSVLDRNRSALWLGSLRRLEQQVPIMLSALHLGPVKLLHLPGEPFIEFQLRAQAMQPDAFVCTAGYGDSGPWYIPVKEEWDSGGYEVSSALCEPVMDDLLTAAMKELLAAS
jgi:hypothetical protein